MNVERIDNHYVKETVDSMKTIINYLKSEAPEFYDYMLSACYAQEMENDAPKADFRLLGAKHTLDYMKRNVALLAKEIDDLENVCRKLEEK